MKAGKIVRHLFAWYELHRRDLPWRHIREPYLIWVSEIMLQQTQVSRVRDYYERFIKRFPAIESLAEADWEEFLPYWRGLGFYSRGRNMLKTAQKIAQDYHGEFPRDRAALEALPGIAAYTSAAILSFAFNEALPALDTNISRVLQRVHGCTAKGVKVRAEALFGYTDRAADLNHALMDLGALICRSRKTECDVCPLQKECHFYQSGKLDEWRKSLLLGPRKKIGSKKILMEVAVACIHQNGRYLITKRSLEKGGFWEFPGGKREIGEDWRHALKREIQEEIGVEISVRPHFFETVWEEKEYFWRIRFFRCQILQGVPQLLEHSELAWVEPQDLGRYDFPLANKKAVERLKKMRISRI